MKQVKALVEACANLSSEERAKFWHALVCSMNASELMAAATALKDAFDITLPVPVVAQPIEEVEVIKEQTEFDVILKSFGSKKVPVIKEIRKITSLGLLASKKLVESAPTEVEKGVSKEKAQKAKAQLEEAGATVEIV